ncbi:MAG TPA: NUDIX domain-containing protein [Anaerolineales bacterium]|nr:NUDIX domain-containing protein [Anaerolineales bacterium]
MPLKVVAYITRGPRLLVFEHAGLPEAGLQVPAGTVEPGEPLADALWREVFEESGLGRDELCLQRWLAVMAHPAYNVVRHYAWLTARETTPDIWAHLVSGSGDDNGLTFNYRWERLPLVGLVDRFDEALDRLPFQGGPAAAPGA